ncbi:cytochrome P450 307a1-like [Venturia canescens]|uniref:cytochrome P450 307a1-like n=1 Tax=Venturia canescens TaxID=32260 RepID=UPI001C9C7C07|nr:cytochrome P450 307a1-like [Venturia canescens]
MASVIFWVLLSCATALWTLTKILSSRSQARKNEKCPQLARNEGTAVRGGRKSRRERANKFNQEDFISTEESQDSKGPYEKKVLRGPTPLPLIGSLHLLRGPAGPFDAFTRLSHQYGDIYEIQLGVAKCVVVSSYNLLKEVLITKGSQFGGRPDFLRFHQLFGGDRNNSLALCDWSDLQRQRRSIARSFCSPRGGSPQQEEFSRIGTLEATQLLRALEKKDSIPTLEGKQSLKPLLLASLANMFTRYMCSTRFSYEDEEFRRIVRSFDEIFWDINQGSPVDFLPWLSPFYTKEMNRLNDWSTDIRSFILRRIIDRHRETLDTVTGTPRDFTDALLLHLESPQTDLSWQHIIYELEDFIGGHSAVGNLVMLILANTAVYPEVQKKIQAECDNILSRADRTDELISFNDRLEMAYTEAVIWETLRIASSPIVPHVATEDTDIDGYPVAKDTVVFVNNFHLNLGESYWGPDSREFRPERFLKPIDGASINDGTYEGPKYRVHKPEYFVPFSTGKRTCIGQRLVQGFAFIIVTALVSRYDVLPVTDNLKLHLLPGCVAVPPDPFHLKLQPRKRGFQASPSA